MKDVARKANVSITTVSLVLNDAPGISAATRELVRSVIKDLKYTPDSQARKLSSGRTHTVALVMPPWSAAFADPYFLDLMRGTLESVRDKGYQMLLEVSDRRFMEHKLWHDLFAGKRIDGLIIATPYLDQSYLAELSHLNHPAILLNGERADLSGLGFVGYDDLLCGEEAVLYLAKLGHRRIAHIAGDQNHASAVKRLQGYKNGLEKAGLPFRDEDVVMGSYMPLEAKEAVKMLLSRPVPKRPTAIFSANDTMAVSAINYLKELGYRIPGDFSIIGVDDTGAAVSAIPALTTFRQDLFALARHAADLFLEVLEKKGDAGSIRDRTTMPLIERDSCAPPPYEQGMTTA
jgi:LacI family transcriptional regulator